MNDQPGVEADGIGPGLISERDAAEWLGLSVKSLFNLRRRGALPFCRIGTRILYTPADLQAFVEQRKEIQAQPAADAGEQT